MTKEEHTENINEIIKSNRTIKSILDSQNNRLSWIRDYVSADFEEPYQRGLNDAWECVMKIAVDSEKLFNIFGTYSYHNVFEKYTPQEAIAKIVEYEKQKNAIKIGDEVILNHDDTKAVVMDESDQEDAWWVYTENGCVEEWHDSKFRKTGRTFPQIEEVLKAMQRGES